MLFRKDVKEALSFVSKQNLNYHKTLCPLLAVYVLLAFCASWIVFYPLLRNMPDCLLWVAVATSQLVV